MNNTVLEKDEEDQFDYTCAKWNITLSRARKERPTYFETKEL